MPHREDALVYLYGVVPAAAPAPPESLGGIDEASVRLVRAGGIAGIVSTVAADAYREDALDARLSDVAWVGQRAVEHERVLTWFVDRTTVVPSAPFSLHASDARLRDRLAEQSARMEQALARLQGHQEMGIRIWRDEARFAEHLDRQSSMLADLQRDMAAATPGRRYLLQKKLEAARTEEATRATDMLVRQADEELRTVAADACWLAIPPAEGGARPRTLVLHAAYLVPATSQAAFSDIVQRIAAAQRSAGLDWEYTGPWPAYHFVASQ